MPTTAVHTREEQLQRIATAQQQTVETRRREAREFEEAIEEIHRLRKEVDDKVAQLHEKAQHLRRLARRSTDEGASSLLVFANAHVRLAGALNQGVRRASSIDRVLNKAQQDRDDAQRREAERQQRREAQQEHEAFLARLQPSEDDFDDVYGDLLGEEEVTNA